jgi:hypothetical protein
LLGGAIPWVNAAIVFPNAFVSVRRKIGQVDVINAGYLERWIAKAPGNREVGRRLAQFGKSCEMICIATPNARPECRTAAECSG